MLHQEWKISGSMNYELYAQQWLPDSKDVHTVVCLSHGSGEHSTRFRNLARTFTDQGIAVLALDHHGHGKSDGKRGHIPSLDAAVQDVAGLCSYAQKRFPELPLFLYGHSMGGNIAVNCALRAKPDIKGLILTSPWLRLAFSPPSYQIWIGKKLAKLFPEMQQSTGLKHEDLYRPGNDQAVSMVNDPLSHTKISLRAFVDLEEGGQWAIEHAGQLQIPLLLIHGDADRITSYAASKELAQAAGEKCTFVTCEGGYHELHNDIDGEKTINQIIAWMSS